MKSRNVVLAFLLLWLMAGSTFAQSKKELQEQVTGLQGQVQALTAERDSLKVETDSLGVERDSLAGQIEPYQKFYFFIRDNYFPEGARDLSLEESFTLLDSIAAARDSMAGGQDSALMAVQNSSLILADSIQGLRDTLKRLSIENKAFRDLLGMALSESAFPRRVEDFLGEWKLIVQPVDVLGESPQSGIANKSQVVMPDSMLVNMITRVAFLDEELAELTYSGGKRIKCFYKINDFSETNTYTIDFDKGKELDLRVYVTHMHKGVQVSYQVPGTDGAKHFHYGFMLR